MINFFGQLWKKAATLFWTVVVGGVIVLGTRTEDRANEDYTFHGYNCLEDCSGHKAGYEWAEENEIDDIDYCDGYSNSFIEGCMAYVEEYY
jgi:hypothetical protein